MSLDALTQHYAGILASIGEDLQRDGLTKTPERAARAMEFLCRGYGQTLDEVVNEAVYSVGFFVFWAICAASSAATCFLQRNAGQVNQ